MKKNIFSILLYAVLAGIALALALNISEKNAVIKEKNSQIEELKKELKNRATRSAVPFSSERSRHIFRDNPADEVENEEAVSEDLGGKQFTPKQIEDRLNLLNFLRENMPKVLADIRNNDEKLIESWTQELVLTDEQVQQLRQQAEYFQQILKESWVTLEPQLAAARNLTTEEAEIEEKIASKIRENSLGEFLPSILTEEQKSLRK